MFGHHGRGDDALVGGRLLVSSSRPVSISRQSEVRVPERRRRNPNTDYAYWVRQNVFCDVPMMFAIITPALIVGAIAERMKFRRSWVCSPLDVRRLFPVGTHGVGHRRLDERRVESPTPKSPRSISPAAPSFTCRRDGRRLILRSILGHRLGFGKEIMAPHSMVLCMVGTGLLWVGWYGFNAGSAARRRRNRRQTRSRPPHLRPRSPPSRGRWRNCATRQSRASSAFAPVSWPVWS